MSQDPDPPPPSLETCFHPFTVPQVLAIVGQVVCIPASQKRTRAKIFACLELFPEEARAKLRELAMCSIGTKRKAAGGPAVPRKRPRVAPEGGAEEPVDVDMELLDGPFFQPPTKRVTEGAVIKMIDRTGNAAMAQGICIVCARKLFLKFLEPTAIPLLPNTRHLVPHRPHPAHKLVGRLLLHEEGMEQPTLHICLQCKAKLLQDERPPLALANGMWIGSIPFELSILTLAERLLIALYFPAAYVIKLYPLKKGAKSWADIQDKVNSAMKGNVSTYRLNTAQIAGIVSGNTMPPSPQILAATIGVTFVGAGNVPLRVMPDFLRVRRQRVFDALVWLKQNNDLYGRIEISQEQLRLLPENAVPDEILLNARSSDDMAGLEREQAGYVPTDADDEIDVNELFEMDGEGTTSNDRLTPEGGVENFAEAVFPLQANGVIDVHGDSVPESELLAHGLSNTAQRSAQDEFLIRRGSAFINEYPRRDALNQRFDGGPEDPNHLLGAFPVLFPYGKGGFEVDRPENVTYEAHVRWALQYPDRRFRKDMHFIFQAFGVIQKRQVCRSAGVQIKRSAFIANKVSFMKLKPQDFVKASAEENRRVPLSNPVIKSLKKQLSSLRARVPATDESCVSIRSQVWGANLYFNPPTIWATLNLPDNGDPVAQVLAGQEIDLDRFIATAGPDNSARAVNIAADPFAAAQFFHLTVAAILEDVFGITANKKAKVKRGPGVVGVVNAYIGTVEAQARGSLHLHILFWLEGAPSSEAMRAALQTEAFRRKVTAFLKETIRADIKGTTGEDVLQMKKQPSIAYSRPVDPREDNYALRRHEAEAAIARAVQVHDCGPNTCMRVKNGRTVCKRRAPWPVSAEDWVHPSGDWGPRRLYGKMNAWNPPLLQICRANQDMKIITHGRETKALTFYITMYIAKKQNKASNASALLAKSMAFQRQLGATGDFGDEEEDRRINRRMITQCANTLSREQELSGPEVVSYLMGWGDRFISHTFVPIYWDDVANALRRRFPTLKKKSVMTRIAEQLNVAPLAEEEQPNDPHLRLRIEDGAFVVKDQMKEYMDRGRPLENMSYIQYHVDTYDGSSLRKKRAKRKDSEEGTGTGDEQDQDDREGESENDTEQEPEEEMPEVEEPLPRMGRPPSARVEYLKASKRKGCRVIRNANLETLPQFIGTWFPRPDNDEYYCANILTLLKPWRDLDDLQASDGTFRTTFDEFMLTAGVREKRIIQNINYFHECTDSAKENQSAPLELISGTADLHDHVRREMEQEEIDAWEVPLTEADVEIARNEKYDAREFLYGHGAMLVAESMGIFDDRDLGPLTGAVCGKATPAEALVYQKWGERLKSLSKKEALVTSNRTMPREDEAVLRGRPQEFQEGVSAVALPPNVTMRDAKQQAAVDMLNVEQRRAHDIIEQHLRKTMAGLPQDQLLMIVRGEGGTGKTVLLNAIAHTFEYLQHADWLARTATTGVAASLVAGVTTHSWAAIPINAEDDPHWYERASVATTEKRKRNILPAKYVNVDECSMLTKRLLAQLSQIVGRTRASNGEGDASKPFGGMNVILFGDFHQFPPVGDATNALYCRTNSKTQATIGYAIFQQFNTVVTLTEQKRITDIPWKNLLSRLRTGECTKEDMETLNSLLVTHPSCDVPDATTPPWDASVLVTPRHGARVRWNTASVIKHCRRSGHQMYICQAEDRTGLQEEALSLTQRVMVAGMSVKKTAKLADRVELAIGMRAMVLLNIATEADLANGTRGEIVDIKLDPREPTNPDDCEIDAETGGTILQYPPVLVLFKPDDSNYPSFEGLPQGTLPIVPSKFGFNIQVNGRTVRIIRRQLAMTPAYAFTDYKSQGQTLPRVFIDLEKPPTGKLTPFSAYVALSRSKGRDNIRLLRGYEVGLFTTHPSEDLKKEDERLEKLTRETAKRYPVCA